MGSAPFSLANRRVTKMARGTRRNWVVRGADLCGRFWAMNEGVLVRRVGPVRRASPGQGARLLQVRYGRPQVRGTWTSSWLGIEALTRH